MKARCKPVDLEEIIQGIEWSSDLTDAYLELATGMVIRVGDDERMSLDTPEKDLPEWQRNSPDLALARRIDAGEDIDDEFLALPDQFDVHEYSIMERFAYDQDDDGVRNTLTRAIHGRGAFRRFKDAVHRIGIQDAWYAARDAAYRRVAVEWCQDNDVPFLEKVNPEERAH
ncbi:MAG: UPF0158 family protein [Planctomycetota bacterium]